MGYIVDFEMPSPPPVRARRNRVPLTIEQETPLVPRAVAEAVWEEASVWLQTELPRPWIAHLARKADAIAARNANFRRRIVSPGDSGRDWLWAFTRHWLSALILKHFPTLHRQLPSSYSVGHPLPALWRRASCLP
jgi:hypothetical protein